MALSEGTGSSSSVEEIFERLRAAVHAVIELAKERIAMDKQFARAPRWRQQLRVRRAAFKRRRCCGDLRCSPAAVPPGCADGRLLAAPRRPGRRGLTDGNREEHVVVADSSNDLDTACAVPPPSITCTGKFTTEQQVHEMAVESLSARVDDVVTTVPTAAPPHLIAKPLFADGSPDHVHVPEVMSGVQTEFVGVDLDAPATCSTERPSQAVIDMGLAEGYELAISLQHSFSNIVPRPSGAEEMVTAGVPEVGDSAHAVGWLSAALPQSSSTGTTSSSTGTTTRELINDPVSWPGYANSGMPFNCSMKCFRLATAAGWVLLVAEYFIFDPGTAIDELCATQVQRQPWPPPFPLDILHGCALIRPLPWPSFYYHEVMSANCLKLRCSSVIGHGRWLWDPGTSFSQCGILLGVTAKVAEQKLVHVFAVFLDMAAMLIWKHAMIYGSVKQSSSWYNFDMASLQAQWQVQECVFTVSELVAYLGKVSCARIMLLNSRHFSWVLVACFERQPWPPLTLLARHGKNIRSCCDSSVSRLLKHMMDVLLISPVDILKAKLSSQAIIEEMPAQNNLSQMLRAVWIVDGLRGFLKWMNLGVTGLFPTGAATGTLGSFVYTSCAVMQQQMHGTKQSWLSAAAKGNSVQDIGVGYGLDFFIIHHAGGLLIENPCYSFQLRLNSSSSSYFFGFLWDPGGHNNNGLGASRISRREECQGAGYFGPCVGRELNWIVKMLEYKREGRSLRERHRRTNRTSLDFSPLRLPLAPESLLLPANLLFL